MTFYVVMKYKVDNTGKEIAGSSQQVSDPQHFLDAKELMRDMRMQARNDGEKNVRFMTLKTSY